MIIGITYFTGFRFFLLDLHIPSKSLFLIFKLLFFIQEMFYFLTIISLTKSTFGPFCEYGRTISSKI
jgi:hypothetical protein